MSISKHVGASERFWFRRGVQDPALWGLAGVLVAVIGALILVGPYGTGVRSDPTDRERLASLRSSVSSLLVAVAEFDPARSEDPSRLLRLTRAFDGALSAPYAGGTSMGEVRTLWNSTARPALEKLIEGGSAKAFEIRQAREPASQRGEATRQLLAVLESTSLALDPLMNKVTTPDVPTGTIAIGFLVTAVLMLAGAALARYDTTRRKKSRRRRPASPNSIDGEASDALQTGIAREVLRAVFEEPETGEPFRKLLGEIERAFVGTSTAIIATSPEGRPPEVLAASAGGAGKEFVALIAIEDNLRLIDGSDRLFWIASDATRDSPAVAVTLAAQGRKIGILVVRSPLFSAPPGSWQSRLLGAAEEVSGIVFGVQRARLDRRLVISEERAAIARELHDSLAQSLSYLKIQASRLQKLLHGRNPATELDRLEVDTIVDEFRSNLTLAYRQLRELITTCRLTMNGRDLGQALEDSAEEFGRRSAVTIDLDNRIDGLRLGVDKELQILQIVREALSNIVRHSQAHHATVTLRPVGEHGIELNILDDGVGIDPLKRQEQHFGLVIMQERARSLGGVMHLGSAAEGGTRISVSFDRSESPHPAAHL